MLVLRTKSRVRSTCRPLSRPQVPRSPRCQVPESPVTRLIEERSDRSAAPRHPAPSSPSSWCQWPPSGPVTSAQWVVLGGPWWLCCYYCVVLYRYMPHAARRAEVEYKGIVPRDLMRNPHSVLGVIGVIAVPFEPCVPFVPFGGQLASPFFSTSDPFSQFGLPIWPPHLVALRLLGDPQAPSALRPFNSLSHTRPRITLSRWRCLGDTVRQPVPPWSSSPSLPFPLLAPSTRFPPPAPASPPVHQSTRPPLLHSLHPPP